MRCRHCNYSLWNIAARQCPECGRAFAPSDYEFVPGTVAFCCPHCDRAYLAQGASGRPDPPRFECDRCHATIHENEMVLRVAEGIDEKSTFPGSMPWLERAHRGRLRAFLATIGLALVKPQRVIRGVPVGASVGEGLAYAVLMTAIVLIVGAGIPWAVWAMLMSQMMGSPMLWFTWWIPVIGLTVFGGVILWALVTHLMLRLTGGCKHGIDRTLHAVTYSAGANALSAVPCVGPYVGWLWWMISASVMVSVGQGVRGSRAAVAVFTAPVLVGVLMLVSWVTMMMGIGGLGGMDSWSPERAATMSLGTSIESSVWQGGVPDHILTMYVGGTLQFDMGSATSIFCHGLSKTTPADIPVGDVTLEEFDALPFSGKLAATAQFLEALPEEEIVAYRFGDFVFTYPGADLTQPDPGGWLVVMLPDPDVNGLPKADDIVYITSGEYEVTEIAFRELPVRLEEQNAHRAVLGLPPLPPLETVTHGAPALTPADP